MKKPLVVALFILSLAGFQQTVLAQRARPFKISFEMDGQPVKTKLTLRIKQGDKLTEIKYVPKRAVLFPKLTPGERFDLWIITDNYTLPFEDMHPDALTVAGWRVGFDVRPFNLARRYMELRLLPARIKLLYYMIYQHADGGITPSWIETDQTLKDFHNLPLGRQGRIASPDQSKTTRTFAACEKNMST